MLNLRFVRKLKMFTIILFFLAVNIKSYGIENSLRVPLGGENRREFIKRVAVVVTALFVMPDPVRALSEKDLNFLLKYLADNRNRLDMVKTITDALVMKGDSILPELTKAVSTSDANGHFYDIKKLIVAAIGKFGNAKALEQLSEMTKNKDPEVVRLAIGGLKIARKRMGAESDKILSEIIADPGRDNYIKFLCREAMNKSKRFDAQIDLGNVENRIKETGNETFDYNKVSPTELIAVAKGSCSEIVAPERFSFSMLYEFVRNSLLLQANMGDDRKLVRVYGCATTDTYTRDSWVSIADTTIYEAFIRKGYRVIYTHVEKPENLIKIGKLRNSDKMNPADLLIFMLYGHDDMIWVSADTMKLKDLEKMSKDAKELLKSGGKVLLPVYYKDTEKEGDSVDAFFGRLFSASSVRVNFDSETGVFKDLSFYVPGDSYSQQVDDNNEARTAL